MQNPLKSAAKVAAPLFALVASALMMLAASGPLHAAPPPATGVTALADAMQKKIDYVNANGGKAQPERKSTVFTQDEINAYFAERRLKIPEGVRTVKFDLSQNSVTAHARVDFDEITRQRRTRNPLMYLFTGVHDVVVVSHATSAGKGMVRVVVQSVTVDDVALPRMAMEFFIEKFVNPKYPNVGLDRDYHLPARMDKAVIQSRKGTVTQG